MNDAAGSGPPVRVCALLATFNRRDATLACLSALEGSAGIAQVLLSAVLVDDASSDGTAEAVRARFRWAEVLQSEGDLYWCRSMHRAFGHALAQGHDHYLWLNDDCLPDADALARILACHDTLRQQPAMPLIVVGSTRDPATGSITYGGERRSSRWQPIRLALVPPGAQACRVDTFNGNFVLVNAAAAARVGNLDAAFEHAMGDTDYGLRAGRAGVECWLAPGTYGQCATNPTIGTASDPALPWRRRWQLLLGRKGLPPRSWWRFTQRHGGWLALPLFVLPYARLLWIGLGVTRTSRGAQTRP